MVASKVEKSKTILLVVKDDKFRNLYSWILSRNGYHVLTAANSEEAVKNFREHGERVELLLADAVIPDYDGKTLHLYLSLMQDDLKALFISGYFDIDLYRQGVLDPEDPFLEKPFMPDELMEKMREVLE